MLSAQIFEKGFTCLPFIHLTSHVVSNNRLVSRDEKQTLIFQKVNEITSVSGATSDAYAQVLEAIDSPGSCS